MIYTTLDGRSATRILDDILNSTLDFADAKPFTKSCTNNFTLKQEKDTTIFRVQAIGLKKSDISMRFENKYLLVKGKPEKTNDPLIKSIDHKVYVGDNIDTSNIKASLDSGILMIEMGLKDSKDSVSINF
jgi:HSP20 family molecular chaperone IbpA